MHYSDAFRNIFKGGALCKRHFPSRSSGIKMRKGGAAWAIVCHFCPHACSNDNYAYCHLAAIHLNIQWGCGTCHAHQWIPVKNQGTHSVPLQKRAPGSSPTHHAGKMMVADQTHPQTVSRAMMKGQQKSLKRRRRTMMMMKSPVPMLMRLVWMPWIPSRVSTWVNLLIVQTLACCPTSLGVDYQRDGMAWLQ